MKDNLTPEEKLLRLIKGQKKQTEASEFKPAISAISPAARNIDMKADSKSAAYSAAAKYLSFFSIKTVIIAVLVLSGIYLITVFVYPAFSPTSIQLPKITSENIETETTLKEEIKPYEYYAQGAQRQIFSNPVVQAAEKPAEPTVVSADVIKDVSLVGIISGDNPQAVIEDKKTQKTYYVGKGQNIGDIQVEEIQNGKVILNYKGQKFELYL